MATLRSNSAKTSFVPATRPQGSLLGYSFTYAVASNPAANDILILGPLPTGCTLLSFWIDIPDMDSNGSPTLAISVGDKQNAARFLASTTTVNVARSVINSHAITVGQTLGAIAGTIPQRYAGVISDLRITFTATAATFVAGTINGYYVYTMYPQKRDPGQ